MALNLKIAAPKIGTHLCFPKSWRIIIGSHSLARCHIRRISGDDTIVIDVAEQILHVDAHVAASELGWTAGV